MNTEIKGRRRAASPARALPKSVHPAGVPLTLTRRGRAVVSLAGAGVAFGAGLLVVAPWPVVWLAAAPAVVAVVAVQAGAR